MFRNVFVGVDGSPTGRDAITLAIALAELDARITLAHVHRGALTIIQGPDLAFASTRPWYAIAREESLQLLEAQREVTGVSAELMSVSAPSVGRGLHELAEERAADLLVIGSCTRGLAGRVLVGDDTRAALNGTPCAVAIAPRGYVTHRPGFTAVGLGFDFSNESHAALTAAREVAARYGSELKGLRVLSLPSGAYASPMPSDWGGVLARDRKDAEDRLKSIDGMHGTVVYGVAAEELAAFSDCVDLLVVGSRNYGPLRRLLLGSTSSRLWRHARCPLLVLPRAATGEAQPNLDQSDCTGVSSGGDF